MTTTNNALMIWSMKSKETMTTTMMPKQAFIIAQNKQNKDSISRLLLLVNCWSSLLDHNVIYLRSSWRILIRILRLHALRHLDGRGTVSNKTQDKIKTHLMQWVVNNIEKKETKLKEIKQQYTNRKCGDLSFTPIESSRESSPSTFLKDAKIMLHNISYTLPYDLYYLPSHRIQ